MWNLYAGYCYLGLIHSNVAWTSISAFEYIKIIVSIRRVYVIWYEKYLESVSGMS